jgi:hypothetical protein
MGMQIEPKKRYAQRATSEARMRNCGVKDGKKNWRIRGCATILFKPVYVFMSNGLIRAVRRSEDSVVIFHKIFLHFLIGVSKNGCYSSLINKDMVPM